MANLGAGAAAMWCDIDPAHRRDFEQWHAHEHLPERLAIPGFLRGSRWASRSREEAIFVLYELSDLAVFESPAYLNRLDRPTAWSARMMPAIRNMVRSPCRVSASVGAGLGCGMLTLRFAPEAGREDVLRDWLMAQIVAELPKRPGLVAAHLLEARVPQRLEQTTEQRMRGGDAAAAWVLLVNGHDHDALDGLLQHELATARLVEYGALAGSVADRYELVHVMLPVDLNPTTLQETP